MQLVTKECQFLSAYALGRMNCGSSALSHERVKILTGALPFKICLKKHLVRLTMIHSSRYVSNFSSQSKDEPEIYANSGLFSPEHSQNGSVGNTPLSASSSKLHSTRTSQSAINGDTLSEGECRCVCTATQMLKLAAAAATEGDMQHPSSCFLLTIVVEVCQCRHGP